MKQNKKLELIIELEQLDKIPTSERTMINYGGTPNYLMSYKERTYVLRTDNQVKPPKKFYELLPAYKGGN